MSLTFQRKKEDFSCVRCGSFVQGNGYTDHCPQCLTSLHVDIYPGDRAHDCRGIFVPIWAQSRREGYVIYYQCEKCQKYHRVKAVVQDAKELLIQLASCPIDASILAQFWEGNCKRK